MAARSIKETEYSSITDNDKQLAYLKEAMADGETARWAMAHLIVSKDPAARKALEDAAKGANVAVARQSKSALMFMDAQKGTQR